MTKLLQQAFEVVQQMPPNDQDDIARVMFSLAQLGDAGHVDPEHWQEALDARAAVRRGDIASPDEVTAAFRSFDP